MSDAYDRRGYVGAPQAVHVWKCNAWRAGRSRRDCTCGAAELQALIDTTFASEIDALIDRIHSAAVDDAEIGVAG